MIMAVALVIFSWQRAQTKYLGLMLSRGFLTSKNTFKSSPLCDTAEKYLKKEQNAKSILKMETHGPIKSLFLFYQCSVKFGSKSLTSFITQTMMTWIWNHQLQSLESGFFQETRTLPGSLLPSCGRQLSLRQRTPKYRHPKGQLTQFHPLKHLNKNKKPFPLFVCMQAEKSARDADST